MRAEERAALGAVQFNWAVAPDDVWSPVPHHVAGLHTAAARDVLDGVAAAARSTGASPIGIALEGERGVGKTHMLGWLRQQVQAQGGWFFLVKVLEGTAFWRSAVHGVVSGLHAGGGDQLTPLLRALAERAGLGALERTRVAGPVQLTREALDEFVAGLRRLDVQVGFECQDTARALVLYRSANDEHKEVGYGYFQLDGEVDEADRAAWGFRRHSRTPQQILGDLSRLLALVGPTVVAVDQIDTLMAQSSGKLGHRGGRDLELVNQVADGLMELRELTRRTLTVVACIPTTWELIRDHAMATAADRFRVVTLQGAMPDAGVAADLVARHLGRLYAEVGYEPPHPTWPVAPSAFADGSARHATPRRLLQRVDSHIRACLLADDLVELGTFREAAPAAAPARPGPSADLDAFDARFAELRRTADVADALDPRTEDSRVPALLAAGLTSFIAERGERGAAFALDPPPGTKPALHARLRLTVDERTEDEVHWAFRAIGAEHHRAVLTRLRAARTETGASPGSERRTLVLLRDAPFSRGPKTAEEVAAFRAAGGRVLPVSVDDLRTFAALEVLQRGHEPGFLDWVVARRPASGTQLFREVLADAEPPAAPDDTRGVADDTRRIAEDTRGVADDTPAVPDDTPTVALGREQSGGRPFRVPLELLRKHTAVFAGSGSGKTVLLRRLVEECALHGVSSIVLDPNNDLARLGDPWPAPPSGWDVGDAERAREYHEGTEVVVWTPRRERGRPIAFRPLPDFREVLDDADEFRAALDAAVAGLLPRAGLTGKKVALGRAVLLEALERHARDGHVGLPGFLDLLADLPEGTTTIRSGHRLAGEMAEALLAATVNDPLFGGAGEPLDPGVLLTPSPGRRARISVINFVGLPSDEQRQSFVSTMQMALFAWIKAHPAGDRPLGGLLVMDEAQTFAPSGALTPCTDSTLALAAQARKYGLGLVFATQAPKGLHNRIPGNALTQFYGFLNSPTQIATATELARAKGGRVEDVSRLRSGEFYGASEGLAFTKLRMPMCLSHHPPSPLTAEEVLERARAAA